MIKNVAGYDLAKVVHGSYGTLAVVAEVVLRLHPVPKAAVTVELPCALTEAAAVAARVLGSPIEPAALEWTSDDVLLLRLEGTDSALGARADRVREVLGAGARVAEGDPWARHAALTRATRTPRCCASACGPPGCRRCCSPRCPRRRPPPGWVPASRR